MNHSHGEDEKKTARSYPIRAHLYSTLRLSVRPAGQSENFPQIGQGVQFLSKHGKNIHTPPKGEVCIFVQLVRGSPPNTPGKTANQTADRHAENLTRLIFRPGLIRFVRQLVYLHGTFKNTLLFRVILP